MSTQYRSVLLISTHTLRKEGDNETHELLASENTFQPTPSARRVTRETMSERDRLSISTHTLRKEGDPLTIDELKQMEGFQPTPSARRVTFVYAVVTVS